MASFASSSRLTIGRASAVGASSRASLTQRHFASSSRTQESRQVSIIYANMTATFTLPTLPSLSSLLEPLLPATASHQPALAGMPSNMMEESSSREPENALEWDGILNAVPKSKVSHSRKAMRAANKGLKDRVDFVHCASCGQPKLAHHICASCFSVVNRVHKAVKKDLAREEMRAASRLKMARREDSVAATSETQVGESV